MFKASNSLATEPEIIHFQRLFDENNNGMVDYMKFLSFAAKQVKPCHKHRRYICGECTQYGICFRMGCSCIRFTASASAKGQICTCGHTNRTHELEPMDNLDEEDCDPHTNFTSEKVKAACILLHWGLQDLFCIFPNIP